MVTNHLWDIDSIKVTMDSRTSATIRYNRKSEYVNSYDRETMEVKLNFFDMLIGRKINEKVIRKIKELTIRLERENEEIKDLITWEEDFNKRRK